MANNALPDGVQCGRFVHMHEVMHFEAVGGLHVGPVAKPLIHAFPDRRILRDCFPCERPAGAVGKAYRAVPAGPLD